MTVMNPSAHKSSPPSPPAALTSASPNLLHHFKNSLSVVSNSSWYHGTQCIAGPTLSILRRNLDPLLLSHSWNLYSFLLMVHWGILWWKSDPQTPFLILLDAVITALSTPLHFFHFWSIWWISQRSAGRSWILSMFLVKWVGWDVWRNVCFLLSWEAKGVE